jgi:DNA-binding PadR family transcriptional regulator
MGERVPKMTPALFHVLLALAEGPRHGYALLGAIAERTGGRIELGPSSLYYSLGRLEDAGLITETAPGAEGDEPHEEQRRYYRLTSRGRRHLSDELGLLHGIVDHARAIGFGAAPAGRE